MSVKRLISSIVLVCLSFLVACNSGSHPPRIGSAAPEFTITDSQRTVSLNQFQGKPVVLNFWATWCPPCREEMPAFSRLQTKYAANGVEFVGIALDTPDNVIAFLKQIPVSYPLLLAESEGMELTQQLGNSRLALPYTVVLGPNEKPLLIRLGKVPEQELDDLLGKITHLN